MTNDSEGVKTTNKLDSQQQNYIEAQLESKDAVDAAFSLGIKFGFLQMKRRGQI